MSKVSNKLAAGMRKVKVQESKPRTVETAERKTEAQPVPVKASKPAPVSARAERVWPD